MNGASSIFYDSAQSTIFYDKHWYIADGNGQFNVSLFGTYKVVKNGSVKILSGEEIKLGLHTNFKFKIL